jgi:ABC-2 type transport system permease protein
VKISLTGLYLGQVLVAVLGVLAVGGEYGTGMIGVTFTAMPRLLVVLGSVYAGRLILPRGLTAAHGRTLLALGSDTDIRATFGSMLYLVLIALLALGIILGLLFAFPLVVGCFPTTCSPGTWSRPAR